MEDISDIKLIRTDFFFFFFFFCKMFLLTNSHNNNQGVGPKPHSPYRHNPHTPKPKNTIPLPHMKPSPSPSTSPPAPYKTKKINQQNMTVKNHTQTTNNPPTRGDTTKTGAIHRGRDIGTHTQDILGPRPHTGAKNKNRVTLPHNNQNPYNTTTLTGDRNPLSTSPWLRASPTVEHPPPPSPLDYPPPA